MLRCRKKRRRHERPDRHHPGDAQMKIHRRHSLDLDRPDLRALTACKPAAGPICGERDLTDEDSAVTCEACCRCLRLGRWASLRSHHELYSTWSNMIDRCHNPNSKSYRAYGAKGIRVCERWRGSFEAFISDVGPRPSAEYSIDRYPDNAGNYEPGNVRWATRIEQRRNRPDNRVITVDGVTATAAELADKYGMPRSVVHGRLCLGWSPDEALKLPYREGSLHCRPNTRAKARYGKRSTV